MRKSTSVLVASMVMGTSMGIDLYSTSNSYAETGTFRHFKQEPNEFLKDPANTSGENVVPDKNLRKMINRSYGRGNTSEGKMLSEEELSQLNVTKEMLENLIYLSPEQCVVHDKNEESYTVKNLEGLQYAKDLEYLSLVNQEFKDLTPIKGCTKLRHLDIRNTNVTDISALKDMSELESLDMRAVKCGDISALANKKKLKNLSAFGCKINDISPLKGNNSLVYLDLSQNDFGDISALSEMTNLEHLNISKMGNNLLGNSHNKNYITDLSPLKNCKKLKFIDFSNNHVSDLTPLKDLTNLKVLFAGNNLIKDLSPIAGLNLDSKNFEGNNANESSMRKLNIIQIKNPEDITVNNLSEIDDKLPKSVKAIVSNKEEDNKDSSPYIYQNTIKYIIKDEEGSLVNAPLSFVTTDEKGNKTEIKSNNGVLKYHAEGKDRGNVSLSLESKDYKLKGSYKFFEKHCTVDNHIKHISKDDKDIDVDNFGGSSNYVNLSDKDKNEVLTIVVSKNKVPTEEGTSDTSENVDNVENNKKGSIENRVIKFVIKDEEGNLIKDGLKFDFSDAEGMDPKNLMSNDGEVSFNLTGTSYTWRIELENDNYELAHRYSFEEDYNPSNNNLKKIDVDNNRYTVGKEIKFDGENKYIDNNNILTIVLKKKVKNSTARREVLPTMFVANVKSSAVEAGNNDSNEGINKEIDLPVVWNLDQTRSDMKTGDLVYVGDLNLPNNIVNKYAIKTVARVHVNNTEDKNTGSSSENKNEGSSSNNESNKRSSSSKNTYNKGDNNVEKVDIIGKDRSDTSVILSKKYYTQADNVILINGNKYSDGIVSSPLSAIKKAPVLLLKNGKMSDSIKDEIERLNVKNVFIIGGENSINADIENTLSQKYSVKRISGRDRYETSKKMYEEVTRLTNSKSDAIMVSGENIADSLSASNISTTEKIPVLLTRKDRAPEGIDSILKNDIKKLLVVGGEKSISNYVFASKNAVRISGKDRYETSLNTAKHKFASTNKVIISSGNTMVDALSSSGIIHIENSPLILVKNTSTGMKDGYFSGINKIIQVGKLEK